MARAALLQTSPVSESLFTSTSLIGLKANHSRDRPANALQENIESFACASSAGSHPAGNPPRPGATAARPFDYNFIRQFAGRHTCWCLPAQALATASRTFHPLRYERF